MLAQLLDFKPDGDSSTPLYLQLANKLANGIHNGYWQPDEALPSERVLAETLEISRVTARKAIEMLCERGLLTRKHGSGTYITPKLEQPLSRLTNFSKSCVSADLCLAHNGCRVKLGWPRQKKFYPSVCRRILWCHV